MIVFKKDHGFLVHIYRVNPWTLTYETSKGETTFDDEDIDRLLGISLRFGLCA